MLKKKPPRCIHVKANGDPCSGPRLTKSGIQQLLDQGISLIASPESYCSYHARTEPERKRMSSRGGSHSPKREREERQERERDVIDKTTKLQAYTLIKQLIDATIPDTFPPEPDFRKRAVAVYLAATLCEQPNDRQHFAHELLSRDLRHRDDVWTIAEDEIRAGIDSLDEAERAHAWKLITA